MNNQYQSTKIKKISASEQSCEEIKRYIKEGIWKDGDRLPSENDMADMFGVNRLTVRMALQKLNTLGILETRVGDGTYVKHFSFKEHMKEISEFYTDSELLDDVCEFRKAVELPCLRMAIERATVQEIEQLQPICDKYALAASEAQKIFVEGKNKDKALSDLVSVDIEFHERVCRLSKNTLLIYAFNVAREPIHRYLTSIVKKRIEYWAENDLPGYHEMHSDIYRLIKERDYERCSKIYLDMIDHHVTL